MRTNSMGSSPLPSPTHTKQVAALRDQVGSLNAQVAEAEEAQKEAGQRFEAMKGHLQLSSVHAAYQELDTAAASFERDRTVLLSRAQEDVRTLIETTNAHRRQIQYWQRRSFRAEKESAARKATMLLTEEDRTRLWAAVEVLAEQKRKAEKARRKEAKAARVRRREQRKKQKEQSKSKSKGAGADAKNEGEGGEGDTQGEGEAHGDQQQQSAVAAAVLHQRLPKDFAADSDSGSDSDDSDGDDGDSRSEGAGAGAGAGVSGANGEEEAGDKNAEDCVRDNKGSRHSIAHVQVQVQV